MGGYHQIKIAGGDTATSLNLQKRLRFMAPYLKPDKARLLDCGCGAGEYVAALTQIHGMEAWGVERLTEKIHQAKASNPCADRIVAGDLENLAFPDEHFDIALLNEVLEHVPNEAAVLQEIRRVLRPGGLLLIFSPNRWYPFETHGVYFKGQQRKVPPYVPLIPYIPLRIGERFFDYWSRNYWHGELRTLLQRKGFKIRSHRFVWQTFENISRSQPLLIRKSTPLLRTVANSLERIPLLARFGASQFIVAEKV